MRTSTARRVVVLAAATVVGAVVAAGALVTGAASAASSPSPSEPAPQTRNPLRWPFARTSIWNTPIGTKAHYVPARIRSTAFGVDVDWLVVTRRSDPAVPVQPPVASGEGSCTGPAGHARSHRTQRVPRSLVLPDSAANVSSAFVQPDRVTLVSYGDTARCRPGGPLQGRWSGATSLYGDGIRGGHDGSGMSSLGGSIRAGELTGSAPIRHALKLAVWEGYLFYDAATGGRRWPALRAGSGASQQYRGTVEALRMGALLALPPRATASRLGVRSAAGTKLLAALRDYGAYVVDDGGRDAVDLCVEHQAAADFRKRTGHDIQADADLRADMARMMRALAVVDDNSPATIGGHGARRAAWAPPFRAPAARAPEPVSTSPPSPASSAIKAGPVAELGAARHAAAPTVWVLVAAAFGLLGLGLWGGRRFAGGSRITSPRGL
jgi:hypothetical protein